MKQIDTQFALRLLDSCHSARHYWQVLGKFDTQFVDRMAILAAVQARFPAFGLQAPARGA